MIATMKIAILGGTGRQGPGLALRFALAGHQILIGSRGIEKATEAADEIRAKLSGSGKPGIGEITAHTNEDAAASGEIIVLTIPYPHYQELLGSIKEVLGGKILVDVTVPLVNYKPPQVEYPEEGSAGEQIQGIVGSDVKVIAAYKTTPASRLSAIEEDMSSDVLICGDDEDAKQVIIELSEQIKMSAYDAGPLSNSKVLEGMTAMLIGMNQHYKRHSIDVRLTGI
jgi:hypothetical protein